MATRVGTCPCGLCNGTGIQVPRWCPARGRRYLMVEEWFMVVVPMRCGERVLDHRGVPRAHGTVATFVQPVPASVCESTTVEPLTRAPLRLRVSRGASHAASHAASRALSAMLHRALAPQGPPGWPALLTPGPGAPRMRDLPCDSCPSSLGGAAATAQSRAAAVHHAARSLATRSVTKAWSTCCRTALTRNVQRSNLNK